MFRRLPASLPQDPIIPADLKELGYFINDNDQIRLIQKPEQKYLYRINRNERVNDVYKNAINTCIRNIVKERLSGLGLEVLRLPVGAERDEPHIPIYISRDIQQKSRVVVIFGERNQDLGIWSYRCIGEEGIKVGSAQTLVNAIISTPSVSTDNIPGLIIANPGQLLWYRGEAQAIGYGEYLNVPRVSAVHGSFRIDSVQNRVPGNADYTEHVQYVFQNVMAGLVQGGAKFDIIGLEYTGDAVINYLAKYWSAWRGNINGICLGNPQFKIDELRSVADDKTGFIDFLGKRVRAYFISDKHIETPLPGRNEYGCNCYASGERLYEDGILINCWTSMLDWFNMISVIEHYEEPVSTSIIESDVDNGDV